MNAEVKQTFTPVPMVSYRSSRKLSSYLVRAKLYPIDRIVGSKGCGKKRCEVCVNVCETDTCDDKCLIIFLRASAVARNMLEKPLGSLGSGGTTIDVMTGNILGMRIVFRNIYLDIFIVGNIQVSLKMSR